MSFSIKNEHLEATFNPIGAELISLKSKDKNYIWTVDSNFWNKTSPILFPIVGKLKNNSYLYNEKKYHLTRHGFARDMVFEVIEKSKNNIVFSLQSNTKTKENYPFNFELQIGYILENKTLTVSYNVINCNDSQMPFSIGAHPAIAIYNDFEKHSLLFEKEEVLKNYSLKNDLLSPDFEIITLKNKNLPLNYSLFQNDAIIFKTIQSKEITILENEKPYLKMSFNDFPNLGIWTKKNAPFLCIEPWFGYADNIDFEDDIAKKEGIILLSKHKIFKTEFSIKIF